jgi:hypothetical protein
MNRTAAGHTERSSQKAPKKHTRQESETREFMTKEKWDASWERVALGVAAAAGGGLLAATWIGVGPAALAGVAGYAAYRALNEKRKTATSGAKQ